MEWPSLLSFKPHAHPNLTPLVGFLLLPPHQPRIATRSFPMSHETKGHSLKYVQISHYDLLELPGIHFHFYVVNSLGLEGVIKNPPQLIAFAILVILLSNRSPVKSLLSRHLHIPFDCLICITRPTFTVKLALHFIQSTCHWIYTNPPAGRNASWWP